jgi:hypothetical protein
MIMRTVNGALWFAAVILVLAVVIFFVMST